MSTPAEKPVWVDVKAILKISLISSIGDLPPELAASVSLEEKNYIAEIQRRGLLPFAVTPHFASLARPEQDDPIRRQFFPDPREALPDPCALNDPLGEYRFRAAPRLVHQYRDRALLLAAGTCAGYCRHCFRRVWLSSVSSNGMEELQPELAYLAAHPEIREILLSGGDPLTLDNAVLSDLFRRLREARPGVLLRVCTRVAITEPLRLDSETIALFAAFRPLRLAVQINHPRELSAPSRAALAACVNASIPIHVQTVLLRGINDDPALLAQLFQNCLDLGLSPYYLFQMDLAPGTAHFRVPLKRGIAIYRELGGLISGPGLSAYAVDLPGGGGKIRLHENVIAGEKTTPAGNVYVLKDSNGGEWYYPAGDEIYS
ncbi:MAG: KamA family radical SAM protein [Treponema sp.]|jgi:lysine 2,3-aminomutase|nr:KamA family radical SAM protein [Treponema sp.]